MAAALYCSSCFGVFCATVSVLAGRQKRWDVRGWVAHEGGVTDTRTAKAFARWVACIGAFYVGLQLVWPTPFGIVVWGLVISSLTALLAFGLVLVYRSHRVINF